MLDFKDSLKCTIPAPSTVVNTRKQQAKNAMENEKDPEKKAILNTIYDNIYENGTYSTCSNVFPSDSPLPANLEFVIRCIKLHPELYMQIDSNLKANEEVIMALASVPPFYNPHTEGDYGSYVQSPLWYILEEYQAETFGLNKAIHNLYLTEEEKHLYNTPEKLAANIDQIRNSARRQNWLRLDERIDAFMNAKIPLSKYVTQEEKGRLYITDSKIILSFGFLQKYFL